MGPDAARYLHAGLGGSVPRPFHLRWLLPTVCRKQTRRWWIIYTMSWPLLAVSMFAWQAHNGWQTATAAAVLLLALPGILGPAVVAPVGVDIPASALTVAGVALWPHAPALAVVCWLLAAGAKETSPVFAALWLWSPWPLIALVVPAVVSLVRKPGPDPLGWQFQRIADHPIRSSMESHRGQWRNGWLMVAPWGVCLAALYQPTWQVAACLAVAYGLLVVATDTVRLYQHAAGPVMAATAAQVIPTQWLGVALVFHVVFWTAPQRV